MNTVGTARRIDQLGRVVVPAELRRLLGIGSGDLLDIRIERDRLVLRKIDPECAICHRTDGLKAVRDKHVCRACARAVTTA